MLFLQLLGYVIAFCLGWGLCTIATWVRLHRQDSSIRALRTDIGVLLDMNEEVPPEWMLMRLEELIQKERI